MVQKDGTKSYKTQSSGGKILTLSSRPTTLNFGVSLDGHIPGLRGTEVGTAL